MKIVLLTITALFIANMLYTINQLRQFETNVSNQVQTIDSLKAELVRMSNVALDIMYEKDSTIDHLTR